MDAFLQTFLQQFQYLKIQLEEIISATNNFDDENNYIGVGGFGKVYKGEVAHSEGRSMAAIKRLDPKHGQGTPEFLKEITTLSRYRHENLISLLGFCYQGPEMILVYKHASRGSLDRNLSSPHLTWSRRLKIGLDVAKGLSYLHDPRETHQRLIHCDIKSANILLDEQWSAKVSDFGLSVMGPANEQQSVIVTHAAGTPGYCDPQYAMTHTLTKESDVYSFGVVLFEVLCGTLCCTYSNGRVQQNIVPTWIKSYEEKKLNDIIFKDLDIQPLDQSALETFSDIAYRCLKESREDRPKMAEVVSELETAFESQDFSEREQLFDYEEMVMTAEPPLNYSSKGELFKLLSKGVSLNGSKRWFSLNEKGEHCEMIPFAECLDPVPSEYNSRFAMGPYYSESGILKTHVKTQYLSPGITYTVNLVFTFIRSDSPVRDYHDLIRLEYKLQGETKTTIAYIEHKIEDGVWMCELYQFTCDHRIVDLEILFEGFKKHPSLQALGIDFSPLKKVEHKVEKAPLSDSDANWDKKLPTDYKDITKWSKNSMQWTTKKEAYSLLCKGFLINDGQEWFSLDKNGKKCLMLSARAACILEHYNCIRWLSLTESRFGEAVQFDPVTLSIIREIQSQLLSCETTYASYLVYKLPEDQSGFEAPILVKDGELYGILYWYIYLVSPQTPVIRPKADQNTHNPRNRLQIEGIPRQRNDGWMEVQIWEFQTDATTEMIRMRLILKNCDRKKLNGLIIQGVEFRPK